MLNRIFNQIIVVITTACKTMLLSLVVHAFFLPLLLQFSPIQQYSIEVIVIAVALQLILSLIITFIIYVVSLVILLYIGSRLYNYTSQQLAVYMLPTVVLLYVLVFISAQELLKGENGTEQFVFVASLPHLITAVTGIYLLAKNWKTLNPEQSTEVNNIHHGTSNLI